MRLAARRVSTGLVSLVLILSTLIQQSHADYWLVHGLPKREFIPINPSWFAVAAEFAGKLARSAVKLPRLQARGEEFAVPVEESAGAPRRWQAGDVVGPFSVVNLATGNVFTRVPLFDWDGVSFALHHNSIGYNGLPALSPGWSHSYSAHLELNGESVTLITDDGTRISLGTPDPIEQARHNATYRLTLRKVVTNGRVVYHVTDAAGNTSVFDGSTGRLESMSDASGNETKLTYEGNRLRFVTDPVKRELTLEYMNDRLWRVVAPPLHNGGNEIARAVDLTYSNGLLRKIHSPRRETIGDLNADPLHHVAVTYEGAGPRIKSITDYEGHATIFRYGGISTIRLTNVYHPAVYDFAQSGNVVTSRGYDYDTTPNQTVVTDERGAETVYQFDSQARLVVLSDALGRAVVQNIWDQFNRVQEVINVLGKSTEFTYDANGNLEQVIQDADDFGPQRVTNYTYDLADQPTPLYESTNNLRSVTDALGHVSTFAYDDPANPRRMTEMFGPGAAPLAVSGGEAAIPTVNRMAFQWGSGDPDSSGLLTSLESPNRTLQRFQYSKRNPSRTIVDEEDEDCGEVRSATVSNLTGEPSATGKEVNCPSFIALAARPEQVRDRENVSDNENSAAGQGGGENCLEDLPVGTCGDMCGCDRIYDESGSILDLLESGETSSCGEGALAAVLRPGVAGGSQPHMFTYDGNGRLVAGRDPYLNRATGREPISTGLHEVYYRLNYDARGRMIDSVTHTTPTGSLPEGNAWNNGTAPFSPVYLFPHYRVEHLFSDTTGRYTTLYHRDSNASPPDTGIPPNHQPIREIKTIYETDLAGRITSILRDGKVTKYTYRDSTTSPAVEELRSDGSGTKVYVNKIGETRRIVHTDSTGLAVADYQYTRDVLGRVIRVDQAIRDSFAEGGYREERVEYEYGDGNLTPDELDDPTQQIPNPDKLYYSFIADLGPECASGLRGALCDGDPNRLVRERRQLLDLSDLSPLAVEFEREYRYDLGGNRLVMRERDPRSGAVRSVTRYNYYHRTLSTQVSDTSSTYLPGTPLPHIEPEMDYAGRGRDRLLSTQTFYPEEPERVDTTRFQYDDSAGVSAANEDHITFRQSTQWVLDPSGGEVWLERLITTNRYEYFLGQLQQITTDTYDFCPRGCIACPLPGNDSRPDPASSACTAPIPDPCCFPHHTQRLEFNVYDVFGRRVGRHQCDGPCNGINSPGPYDGRCFDTDPELWAFKFCGYDLVQYDYDGLSNTVLAERSPPYVRDAYQDQFYAFTGDRFVSTYLRGPLGVIARTAEKGNSDTSDNETHYYLADLMGNHVATARDATEGGDSSPVWQAFDAFGAALGKSGGLAGSLGWRGGEGSVSDRETGLVYMQSRHYDPSLGRFVQADALPLASLTTQGANRYIYCENDPVNYSDPLGAWKGQFGIAFAIGSFLGAYYASHWLDGPDHPYWRKFFKFVFGITIKAPTAMGIACYLKSIPRPLLWDALGPGYSPPSMNPLIPAIGLLAGFNAGALSYTLWSVIEDWFGND